MQVVGYEIQAPFSWQQHDPSTLMTLWLYLHFPSLQLESLYNDQSIPIAIVDERKSEVIQLNPIAKKAGVKLGMGLGTAASLCRQLHVHAYDASVTKKQLTHIAQWLYPVTADISLFEPDGLLLKVSNMLSLYSSLDKY
jgi:protein ImuB